MLSSSLKSKWIKDLSQRNGFIKWALAARELRWQLRAGRNPIYLEYTPTCKPRYGYGRPPHKALEALMIEGLDTYRKVIDSLSEFAQDLGRIPYHNAHSDLEPFWGNGWFGSLNAATLYAFIRTERPQTYLEVGSGNSTKFAKRAIEDGQTSTKIISIDPAPRAEIDSICDKIIRLPLEEVDIKFFNQLEAGDIVLIDNSHLCLQNSDVTVFFLEVLPMLKKGVLVYIYDIFLPYDYPAEWSARYYSEQYVLAAVLLCKRSGLEVVMPCTFVQEHSELSSLIRDFWMKANIPRPGGFVKGIWLRIC